MLPLKYFERIKPEDIVRIRRENDDVVFSVRSTSGSIYSLPYSEISSSLEDVRIYQARVNLANYELTDFYELDEDVRIRTFGHKVLTSERVAELKAQIALSSYEIQKYNRLSHFFDQLVEMFLAELIQDGKGYLAAVTTKIEETDREAEATLPHVDNRAGNINLEVTSDEGKTIRKRRSFTQIELETLIPQWVDGVKEIYDSTDPPITVEEAFRKYADLTLDLFGESFSWGTIKKKFDESGATFTDGGYTRKKNARIAKQ